MIPVVFHGHNKPVMALKFNDDGDLLFTGGKDGIVNLWRTDNNDRIGTYKGHKSVIDLDVNHSTTLLATGGMDFHAKVWHVESGRELLDIELHGICRCVGISHDDSMLFIVCDKYQQTPSSLKIFKLPAVLHEGKTYSQKMNPVTNYTSVEKIMYAVWGPTNDHIYVGLEDGALVVIDTETGEEVSSNPSLHAEEIRRVRFDANYRSLTTASKDKSATLVDLRSLGVMNRYTAEMPVNDACISPKGEHVLLAGGVEAVDVTTSDQSGFGARFYHKIYADFLGQVQCHFGTIHRVAFMPNGAGFATAAEDGFAKLLKFEDNHYRGPGGETLWQPPAEEDEDAGEGEDAEDDA